MSLDTALSGALSSLQTVQQQISLVSNNINNANTPGYTRKTVQLQAAGDGVDLVGVKISDYQRTTNDTLLKQYNSSLSEFGKNNAQSSYLNRVQDIFGSSNGTTKLSSVIQKFSNSWLQLQAEPESTALQADVINTGTNLANEIRRLTGQVELLDRNIVADTETSIDGLNAALNRISLLNQRIASGLAANNPIGDYEDQRDTTLQEISGYLQIRVMERANGQIAIYTPTGYPLLDGNPQQFNYDGNNVTLSGSTSSANSLLTGGSIEGLLGLRLNNSPTAASPDATQEVIRKLRGQLDNLVSAFTNTTTAGTFGYEYNNATTGTGELASNFFTGTSRTDFNINSSLTTGAASVKKLAAVPVAEAMIDDTRTFVSDGITTANVYYAGYGVSIIGTWQQGAARAKDATEGAEAQSDYFKNLYTNKTSVSIDEEMIKLQTLQTSYAAAARLVSSIQTMNEIILGMVR